MDGFELNKKATGGPVPFSFWIAYRFAKFNHEEEEFLSAQ
jgi:hypothetical protein